MRMKFFADERFLIHTKDIASFHYPFWLKPEDISQDRLRIFSNYMRIADDIFEPTSLGKADFAVMPHDWGNIRGAVWNNKINHPAKQLSIRFASIVEQMNKPIVVFFSGDCSDERIPLKNVFIFRQSAYCTRLKENEFVYPAPCKNIIRDYLQGQLPIRQKCRNPVVGFCGYLESNSLKTTLKTVQYHGITVFTRNRFGVSPYKGKILRHKMVKYLAENENIETNFLIRNRKVFFNEKDSEIRERVYSDFLRNIIDSDYTLCCRGSGNYSIRFYEVLACGRIPIFVDTDCSLPYDFEIDWKKYCIWIDEKDISRIAEKVLEFHARISPQEFVQLQKECHQLWKNWLSPEGFYSNFYRHFLWEERSLQSFKRSLST